MDPVINFDNFFIRCHTVKLSLCNSSLFKDKTLQESARIVGQLHRQFGIVAEYYYKHSNSMHKSDKRYFKSFEKQYYYFVRSHLSSYKRYRKLQTRGFVIVP
jgi:hypothetical protein